ncbi:integration host factor subunit alpha [Microvirga lotononidis]|uniref:Integration host factor subunit alpha n=1 Tax=Microvirga lotononidis TaxID=864069 RepID=I4Z1W5_9HYPH|nr:integration host factor subunit alpha [Microvirga lotononidis]EIM30207.1 bacterial nucleoid DNA-binding protein [Microvirga lotononidis]WQO31570.1 integration host factor subunit alpha [Microvirga lotononidis]
MVGKTISRTDLAKVVCNTVSLSRAASAELVGQVLGAIGDALVSGESVKLSGFGLLNVRQKSGRIGRNPKTGETVPVEPSRTLTFSASPLLKSRINGGTSRSHSRRRKGPFVLAQAATE